MTIHEQEMLVIPQMSSQIKSSIIDVLGNITRDVFSILHGIDTYTCGNDTGDYATIGTLLSTRSSDSRS